MSEFHRDHVPNPRAPRKAALWALLTGESLTTARQVLIDDKAFRATPPQDLMKVQGFVTAGSALPADVRKVVQEVADGLAQSEPPRWPGLEALAAERDAYDETGRHDNGRDQQSVLGRVRATPAQPVPRPNLHVVWSRPEPAPKRDRLDGFDYGILVASIGIAAFFGLRAVVTSALFEALTR